jgi:hypothetical protein
MRTLIALSLLISIAHADPPKMGPKGIWKVLVRAKAKWVLKNTFEKEHDKVIIETYDVRKVGVAEVARLRWTRVFADGQKEPVATGLPTQVAVTDAGLYLLDAAQDDAAITEAIKKKPSRSDPPKAYKGTKQNEGRYLNVESSRVCLGQGPLPGAGECEDTCFGEWCVSAEDGIVGLEGNFAPENGQYERP